MNVAGNSRSFREPLFEPNVHLLRQLAEPQAMQAPKQKANSGRAQEPKRDGLIKRGLNGELAQSAGLVPNAVIVAGCDAKSVRIRGQVRVHCLAAYTGFLPSFVESIEHVTEPDFLGSGEAQRRVVDLQFLRSRR